MRLFGLWGSFADTSVIASTGQALTHLPQPLQRSTWTCGMKLVVWTGSSRPKRRAAIIASQQQPQQLQMNATPRCTFSPNWTRLLAYASCEQVHPLDPIHAPCVAMADERIGGPAERHADVLRGIAGPPDMLRLVAAVADADAHVLRGPDHLARALVVEDAQRALAVAARPRAPAR